MRSYEYTCDLCGGGLFLTTKSSATQLWWEYRKKRFRFPRLVRRLVGWNDSKTLQIDMCDKCQKKFVKYIKGVEK